MSISNNKLMVRDLLSEDLVLRGVANSLFKKINSVNSDKIVLDFKGTKYASRSFAQEYLTNKSNSQKQIHEENIPQDIKKMLSTVKNSKPKKLLKLKTISLTL